MHEEKTDLQKLLTEFKSTCQTEPVLPMEWALASKAVNGKVVIPPFRRPRKFSGQIKWAVRLAALLVILNIAAAIVQTAAG